MLRATVEWMLRETGKTLLYYWWRAFYFGIAIALIVLLWTGSHSWGGPFIAGALVAAFGYQIAHYLTYGRWFE